MSGKGGTVPTTYAPLPPNIKKQVQQQQSTFKDEDWTRGDGRSFHQCRPAYLRTAAVNAASGSAYAEFGNTKVIVSVFGPRESKKAMMYSDIGRLNCNVSYTTFATPNRSQGSDHKEFSSMLHKALEGAIILESFPKTTVDVFALVLESGGSDLPVIISCASVALADAGIMMFDLVSSVSVSCLGKNIVIDPTLEEENFQDGSLMIACMPSRNEVTQLTLTGEWSTPKIHEVSQSRMRMELNAHQSMPTCQFGPVWCFQRISKCWNRKHASFLVYSNSRNGIDKWAMELCLDACLKLGKIMRSCLKEAAAASQ